MKKNKMFLAALITLGIVVSSCSQSGSQSSEKKASPEEKSASADLSNIDVDAEQSKILWAGTSLGVYTHTGTVDFIKADLETNGGKINGGSFTVDLTSMVATDENFDPEKGSTKEKLIGHLKSPDFFDVENYPNASFEITNVDGNEAMGKLTIRGITHEEKVTDINIEKDGEQVKITGKLVFDRKKYDVSWDYNMKDMLLKDEIELKIHLIGS